MAASKKKTRLEAVKLLPEVIRRLLSISDPDVLLHEVLTLANDALGADEVSLLLLDRAGRELVEHEVVGKKLRPTRHRLRVLEEGIVGWVASHRLPQVVADVRKDKRYVKGQGEIRSEAAVPILSGDRLIGVLNFESRKVGFFQKGDLELLGFLAAQLAIALRMVDLSEGARRWQERMSALHNLLRLGGGVVPRETVLRRVVDTVRLLCGGHYAAVFQGDYDRDELVLLAQSSATPVDIEIGSRLKFRTGLTGKAFEIGETVNVRDVRNESMYLDRVPGVLSEACVPLRVGDRCVGILDAQAPGVGEFTDDEVLFLEAVARFLAPALQAPLAVK
ncbi:MAG TPA: GAF domain-containing protein [Planctomycetota bacterium]|nr:GAF domain-containing protein [Planctomycetota bacterium]